MSSVNKVILVGRAGKDPETRHLTSGDAVTNLSLATSERWTDKSTGELKEKTEWHRIGSFGKVAELIGQYVKKGDLVYVEGKLQTRKWTDKDGADKYSTEIIVDRVQFLTRANREGGEERERPAKPAAQPKPAAGGGKFDDFEDDLPF